MSAISAPIEGRGGFALVDILVALAVAGLAGSTLVGLVAFVGRQQQEALRREHMQDSTIAARLILQTLLSEAPALAQGGQRGTGLRGTDEEFVISSLGSQVLGLDHPVPFTLRTETVGAEKNLVLSWTSGASGPEHREKVAEGYREAEFSFFGRSTPSDQPIWRSRWVESESRLEAVRLRMHFDHMSSTTEIVVPVAADFPAACLRNPRLPDCPLTGSR